MFDESTMLSPARAVNTTPVASPNAIAQRQGSRTPPSTPPPLRRERSWLSPPAGKSLRTQAARAVHQRLVRFSEGKSFDQKLARECIKYARENVSSPAPLYRAVTSISSNIDPTQYGKMHFRHRECYRKGVRMNLSEMNEELKQPLLISLPLRLYLSVLEILLHQYQLFKTLITHTHYPFSKIRY